MLALREYSNHEPKPVQSGDILIIDQKDGAVVFQRNGRDLYVSQHNTIALRYGVTKTNDFARFIADLAELDVRPLCDHEGKVRYQFVLPKG